MSVTVVGSIAFDAVKTPFGERPRMLGGSAVHFALAASFFDEVHVVGPVGDDFGEDSIAVLARRGVQTDDIERVAGGRTFFWSGVYGWDLNDRETLDTQLNVFADFAPKLSERSRDCDVLFLANIQPDLQRQVRAQCAGARFVALDSMNLWIEIARDSLIAAIAEVDCLILNDAELRQLTAEPNLVLAARKVREWGPRVVVAKQGEYGAAMVTEDGFFAPAGVPARDGRRPDRSRRQLRRRLRRLRRGASGRAPASRAAVPGDGVRDRPRVIQRRGVRDRARSPSGAGGDRPAGGGTKPDHKLRREATRVPRLTLPAAVFGTS